jgi:hypothetical protein
MFELKDCDCCQGPIELRFQTQSLPSYLKLLLEQKQPAKQP